MLCHVPAFRQKRAEYSAVAVSGLDHEPFERRGHADGRQRDVHQVAWNDGRGRVHRQPVRARYALHVFRPVTRVPGCHVRARDLQHFVSDGPGTGSLDQQQQQHRDHRPRDRRYDCPGRRLRPRTKGFQRHRGYHGTIRYDIMSPLPR